MTILLTSIVLFLAVAACCYGATLWRRRVVASRASAKRAAQAVHWAKVTGGKARAER